MTVFIIGCLQGVLCFVPLFDYVVVAKRSFRRVAIVGDIGLVGEKTN